MKTSAAVLVFRWCVRIGMLLIWVGLLLPTEPLANGDEERVAVDAKATFQGQPAAAWIGRLNSTEPEMRRAAAKALTDKDAVPVLIAALKSDKVDVRQQSALCLSEIGPDADDAANELIALLKTSYDRDHDTAAIALGSLGADVLPKVIQMLRDAVENPEYRKVTRAIAANAKSLSDESQRQTLGADSKEYLSSSTAGAGALRALARMASRKIEIKPAIPLVIEAASWNRGLVGACAGTVFTQIGDDAVQPLRDTLNNCPPFVFDNLVRALADLAWNSKAVVPLLMKDLQSKDERANLIGARGFASCAFRVRFGNGRQRSQRDPQNLIDAGVIALMATELAKENNSVEIRRAAAETLWGLSRWSGSVLTQLLRASEDPDLLVRRTTLFTLGELAREADFKDRILAAMLKRLKGSAPDDVLLHTVIGVIAEVGPTAQEAVPQLLLFLNAKESSVRSAAVKALNEILRDNDPLRKEVVQLLQKQLEEAQDQQGQLIAVESLKRMGPSADLALPTLLKLTEGTDQFLARETVNALGAIITNKSDHMARVCGTLRNLAKSENANLRDAAKDILRKLESP